jgi:hypothetical protein
MQLWTDYEGVTIDGAFPLKKLLMPEGRSAFFSTAGLNGEPTVVRLIECHFDEEEILSRWRCVEALHHSNFLKFERFGQTEIEGRPVVYAVFEKVDGNLAEVLDQGHLTVQDVAQLGFSLVSALDVLHTHGYVHEHVEARNIFAVGDEVKLRGDCIREAPEGADGRAAKQRDVRDLATVMLQGLTQRRSMDSAADAAMPEPMRQIIRNGLDGAWGLENIRAALESQYGVKKAVPAKQPVAAPVTAPAAASTAAKKIVAGPTAVPAAAKPASPNEKLNEKLNENKLPLRPEKEERSRVSVNPVRRHETDNEAAGLSHRSKWLGIAGVALLVILCVWIVAQLWGGHRHTGAKAVGASVPVASQAAPAVHHAEAAPTATTAAQPPAAASQPATTASRPGWRVIAYTYDRRADAEKKAAELSHEHPDLQPAVFTPSGHAPYLVSVGGVMDRQTARALARRARSLKLPRDTYAQNYNH